MLASHDKAVGLGVARGQEIAFAVVQNISNKTNFHRSIFNLTSCQKTVRLGLCNFPKRNNIGLNRQPVISQPNIEIKQVICFILFEINILHQTHLICFGRLNLIRPSPAVGTNIIRKFIIDFVTVKKCFIRKNTIFDIFSEANTRIGTTIIKTSVLSANDGIDTLTGI